MRHPRASGARRHALLLLLVCAAIARFAAAQTEAAPPPPTAPPAPEAAAPAPTPPAPAPAAPTAQPAPTAPLDPNAAFAAAPAVAPPTEPARTLARDMSVWGMFMDAGLVAKLVMILLILASIWNVSILLEKSLTLRSVNRNADRFLETFRKSKSLEELSKQVQGKAEGPMLAMFVAGMNEFHLSVSSGLAATGDLRDRMRARIQDAMEISRTHSTHELGKYMSLLATVGATAPFIGLFGTVWGIMTSFIGIAQTQTTNLAVVAPGIAEALLATAIGLAAAIPAVMLYNKFSRDIGRFSGRLLSFENEFAIALSRQLDMKA
jgi:biopolymer transport protein TolQ